MLIFLALLGLGCAIANFVLIGGGKSLCVDNKDGTRTCSEKYAKVLGIIGGILWLMASACLAKIPVSDPHQSDNTEMVSMSTGSSRAQNHDVA